MRTRIFALLLVLGAMGIADVVAAKSAMREAAEPSTKAGATELAAIKCKNRFPATAKLGPAFRNLPAGKCWSCPRGYGRTVHPIKGPKACKRKGERGFTDAKFIKKGPICPVAARLAVKGGCYRCPKGFKWAGVEVRGPKACARPGGEAFSSATRRHK